MPTSFVSCFRGSNMSMYMSGTCTVKSSNPISLGRRARGRALCLGMGPKEFFVHGPEDVEPNIFVLTPEGSMRILGKLSRAEMKRPVDRMLEKGTVLCDVGSLCLGATFMVAATNGLDVTRRMNFQGFCQSPDILGECIQDAVLHRGGEILEAEKLRKDGAEERLVMTVAIPLLFGIPPEMDTLKSAIEVGGGFLHKIYGEWYIY